MYIKIIDYYFHFNCVCSMIDFSFFLSSYLQYFIVVDVLSVCISKRCVYMLCNILVNNDMFATLLKRVFFFFEEKNIQTHSMKYS